MTRRPFTALALAAVAIALVGCPKEKEAQPTDGAAASTAPAEPAAASPAAEPAAGAEAPAAGSPIDMAFFKDFPMGMEKGVKRTYTMTTAVAGQKQTMEMSMEVVDVQGDMATVKTTTMGQTTTQQVPIAGGALGQAQAADKAGVKVTSGGTEAVEVPAGSYPSALKVIATTKDGAKVTSWVVRDVGLVKSETEAKAAGMSSTSTMELKSITK